ncbi:MAG: class I SAM-dependent methyltransferase [Chloroflexota bacterium]
MPTRNNEGLGASFRDPNGFLFSRGGILYRQVNRAYADDYARLMESGLYEKLVKAGLLVPHTEVDEKPPDPSLAFKVIQPLRLPFISYPYEWSFDQLKDAALATLSIQKRALKLRMSLKDASAYNIQFLDGKPILIDTLSFEVYREGEPWVAYRQFCQHFLAPLSLMTHCDVRLSQLMRVYIDGVPLDLASRLLPARTKFNFGLGTHIHLHARAQTRYADANVKQERIKRQMSKNAFIGLIESLEGTVRKLEWIPAGTEWGNYYDITNYSDSAFIHKKEIIAGWLEKIKPASVWDLGANNGEFSRLASGIGIPTVAFDIDPAAVEQNYQKIKSAKEQNLLPLVLDLTNPSPALGWANEERDSFAQRGPVDAVFALALIHHLAISNNVPLPRLAEFFHGLGKWLIIEFVPKGDSQVDKLLRSREDIFPDYTREGFERAFGDRFSIREAVDVRESMRRMYLLESR